MTNKEIGNQVFEMCMRGYGEKIGKTFKNKEELAAYMETIGFRPHTWTENVVRSGHCKITLSGECYNSYPWKPWERKPKQDITPDRYENHVLSFYQGLEND